MGGFLASGLVAFNFSLAADFPGPNPGPARALISGDTLRLENDVLSMSWTLGGNHLAPRDMQDKISGTRMDFASGDCFQLRFGSAILRGSEFTVAGRPSASDNIVPMAGSPRGGDQVGGKSFSVHLVSPDGQLLGIWKLALTDGSNYVRQTLSLTNTAAGRMIDEYRFLRLPVAGAAIKGSVDGSPVATGNGFFALENPMAKASADTFTANRPGLRFSLPRSMPLDSGTTMTQTCVAGVFPTGQLRRGFQFYLDRERAHPFRQYLHYNGWFDVFYDGVNATSAAVLESERKFGDSLITRRKVPMSGFVMDDGWDDHNSLWNFNAAFPNGFTDIRNAAQQYAAAVGTWISPWGGYGAAKQQRLQYGATQGFETNANGFSLAGPNYYARFKTVCLGMMRNHAVNYFKFDGVGAGNTASGANAYERDIDALFRLIGELRQADPNLFINTTVGTWPSPFWLMHSDAVWRQGNDVAESGSGTSRQRWMTYRDGQAYGNVVKRGPLYPLNSLMLHGICIPVYGPAAGYNMDLTDIKAEIRSFFAGGTGMQEMYISPQKLTSQMWDALAEASLWSRKRKEALADVHWIGGDPALGNIYGWAGWSPGMSVLALRNPSASAQTLSLDLAAALELPATADQGFTLRSPWSEDSARAPLVMKAGTPGTFTLQPYELRVYDLTPATVSSVRVPGDRADVAHPISLWVERRNGMIGIRFAMQGSRQAGMLRIFSPAGAVVISQRMEPGREWFWDGRDGKGRPLSHGFYFARIDTEGEAGPAVKIPIWEFQ